MEKNIKNFFYAFFAIFGCSVIYAVISKTALKHAKNDTLGVDKDGNKAEFPHP